MEKMPIVEEKPSEEKVELQEKNVDQIESQQEEERYRKISAQAAFEMMYEEINIFPPEIQTILKIRKGRGILVPKEKSAFDLEMNKWWKEKFGFNFSRRYITEEVKMERYLRRKKREIKREKKSVQKREVLENLMSALKNLDSGEPIEQFRQEDRKILYFDEEKNKYFVLENDASKYLGIGDILSDFAWGIKYVPDGEMTEPSYRRIAKKILINETRRNLEFLYDMELQKPGVGRAEFLAEILPSDPNPSERGTIAEVTAREFLSRVSINQDLNFIVERASIFEDAQYKYDFKVRSRKKRRGVGIGDDGDIEERIKKIGIQFTIRSAGRGKKGMILEAKKKYKDQLPVDDIILLKMPGKFFKFAYEEWIKNGKPSGGPEQFLSEKIKKDLLEKVTEGLF